MDNDDSTQLLINVETLSELRAIAIIEPVKGIDKLSYEQAQQTMVIHSVIKWLESYGLQAPFKLDLK